MERIQQPTREELEAFHVKMYPKMMKQLQAEGRLRKAKAGAAAAGSYSTGLEKWAGLYGPRASR